MRWSTVVCIQTTILGRRPHFRTTLLTISSQIFYFGGRGENFNTLGLVVITPASFWLDSAGVRILGFTGISFPMLLPWFHSERRETCNWCRRTANPQINLKASGESCISKATTHSCQWALWSEWHLAEDHLWRSLSSGYRSTKNVSIELLWKHINDSPFLLHQK